MATVGLADPEHAWNKEDVMSQDVDINKLRKNLQIKVLEKQKVDRNPFVQFQKWFFSLPRAPRSSPSPRRCPPGGGSGPP